MSYECIHPTVGIDGSCTFCGISFCQAICPNCDQPFANGWTHHKPTVPVAACTRKGYEMNDKAASVEVDRKCHMCKRTRERCNDNEYCQNTWPEAAPTEPVGGEHLEVPQEIREELKRLPTLALQAALLKGWTIGAALSTRTRGESGGREETTATDNLRANNYENFTRT